MSPMGNTPIFDQVCGERINADVLASGADSQWAGYHGRHRLIPDTPVAAAVSGPPGPGDGFAQNHHRRARTYPAGLPAADGQPAATVWGPPVALPPQVHTRQAPRHAASSSPVSAADRNPTAQGARQMIAALSPKE
jgi:hypothetical protein